MILADKHTLPYYDGRSHKIKEKLPTDLLLQADIYDVHIRDFAPLGTREFARLRYSCARDDTIVAHIFATRAGTSRWTTWPCIRSTRRWSASSTRTT